MFGRLLVGVLSLATTVAGYDDRLEGLVICDVRGRGGG